MSYRPDDDTGGLGGAGSEHLRLAARCLSLPLSFLSYSCGAHTTQALFDSILQARTQLL